ncbi:MAG TPA: protein-methionine-sulfoxide reductase heme-binding subunit MsrQ [Burkholderiales bacterium]|nr:protein-methionine-sulfoxide reductase heme-binding subunit MsrQ [Burkholderiales bacterium]
MRLTAQATSVLKAIVFVAALVPVTRLAVAVAFYPEWLGANPAEFITRSTGDWTLRFLLITLAVTPLRKMLGWHWLAGFRRMLGLYAFFYGLLHLSSYVSFDHVFDLAEILKDIVKRPFITVGFLSLVLMLPLAITSTDRMVRRLGAKRWLALHRVVYVIAPLGVLHFWWMVKADVTEPAIYAVIVACLLGYRVVAKVGESRRRTARGGRAPLPQPRPNA